MLKTIFCMLLLIAAATALLHHAQRSKSRGAAPAPRTSLTASKLRFHVNYASVVCSATPENSEGGDIASQSIKDRLKVDMKAAMKAKEKLQLGTIRAIQAAIKQKEVDDRVDVDDTAAISIMSKMQKQRKESIQSYRAGGREDLADVEQAEFDIIATYMPAQMTEEEVKAAIEQCIAKVEAKTIKDMGKVMAELRPLLAGRADVSEAGAMIKKLLAGR